MVVRGFTIDLIVVTHTHPVHHMTKKHCTVKLINSYVVRMCVRPSAVREFRALVGTEAAEELQCSMGDAVQTSQVLKKCFTRMMNCEKKVFVDQLNMLVKRVTEEGEEAEGRS